MAKRYYIAPVITTEDDGLTRRLPKLPPLPSGSAMVCVLHPTQPWALVLIGALSHLALLSAPDLDALPDFPKDAKLSAMHKPTRDQMAAALAKRGLAQSIVDGADGYRDVLRAIGRRLDANFHEDNFDCSDG